MAVHNNSITVPEAVRQILTRNYPIYQCLKMKLTNFHAIAEYIQPQVQELTELGSELSDFPNIFPLTNSVKLILTSHDYDAIKTKLKHLDIIDTRNKVAKLSLFLPMDAWNTPGVASYITELLYRNGVNIIDAFLGHGDIVIVVNEPDGHVAYDVLRREVRPNA